MQASSARLELAGIADWTVELTTGTEHFGAGEIALTVRSSGSAKVEQRRAGENRAYEGTLDRGELAEFVRTMDDVGIVTLSSLRTTWEMGEDTLRIEVRAGDATVHRADVPANDRFSDDRVARVAKTYVALTQNVTAGDLPYGAAAALR